MSSYFLRLTAPRGQAILPARGACRAFAKAEGARAQALQASRGEAEKLKVERDACIDLEVVLVGTQDMRAQVIHFDLQIEARSKFVVHATAKEVADAMVVADRRGLGEDDGLQTDKGVAPRLNLVIAAIADADSASEENVVIRNTIREGFEGGCAEV